MTASLRTRPAASAVAAAGRTMSRPWLAVSVLSVSLLMIGLDNTILNVALPTLQRTLSATTSQLQWTVDAYLVAFAGLVLAAGNLGDRLGRRRALQAGLILFGTGSALAAISGTAAELIASRSVMGAGGALIMPSTLSIISNIFTGQQRAKAIALWTAIAGVGIALGPVTGGWLLQHYWWGSVFLVNVPVAGIAITASAFLVPESRDPAAGRPDPAGLALSVTGLLSLVYGIIEAPVNGWSGSRSLTAFAAALILLTAFIAWELRTSHPMLQLHLFRNPRFSAASATITLAFFALFGALFFLTQYLQSVLGYDPLQAGARTVPVAAGLLAGAAISPHAARRIGTKFTVTVGMLLAAGGLAVLATLTPGDGYPRVLAALIIGGAGIGLAMAPATDSVMGSLPVAKASIGSAMNDSSRLIGAALGVAVMGTIISQAYRAHIMAATTRLPAVLAVPARGSLQAALKIAHLLGGPDGRTLQAAARQAFADAVTRAAVAGVAIALAAALIALVLLPARAPEEVGRKAHE
jgi:EmrB/QacA subfamily drug resistance transporter